MGTFTHPITLVATGLDGAETVEALVDTGATFTIMPAPVLDRLGVVRDRTVTLRLANGEIEQRSIGWVRVELERVEDNIICGFGAADSPAVIGAHTLETFLLAVDPVAGRLVPVEGYWL